jgi:AraC-like DNA-binding protein
LLHHTRRPLSEIAAEVGYSDPEPHDPRFQAGVRPEPGRLQESGPRALISRARARFRRFKTWSVQAG